MNILFALLLDAWCMPYDPEKAPRYLQNDPVKAYGLCAPSGGASS